MDHALPFQCSARVASDAPVPVVNGPDTPTAQQSEVLTQASPMSKLASEGLVSGVVTVDQTLPFQCSARFCTVPLLPVKEAWPTAQQSEDVMQDTS
jgi:hypothetical protein